MEGQRQTGGGWPMLMLRRFLVVVLDLKTADCYIPWQLLLPWTKANALLVSSSALASNGRLSEALRPGLS